MPAPLPPEPQNCKPEIEKRGLKNVWHGRATNARISKWRLNEIRCQRHYRQNQRTENLALRKEKQKGPDASATTARTTKLKTWNWERRDKKGSMTAPLPIEPWDFTYSLIPRGGSDVKDPFYAYSLLGRCIFIYWILRNEGVFLVAEFGL